MRRYPLRLLRDQSGQVGLVIALAGLAFSAFSGSQSRKAEKKRYKRAMALQLQQGLTDKQKDVESLKLIKEIEDAKLKTFEASSFQKGSYTGPYFQMVSK